MVDRLAEQHRQQRWNRADPRHREIDRRLVGLDLVEAEGASRPLQGKLPNLKLGLIRARKAQRNRRQLGGKPGGLVIHPRRLEGQTDNTAARRFRERRVRQDADTIKGEELSTIVHVRPGRRRRLLDADAVLMPLPLRPYSPTVQPSPTSI